MQDSTIEKWLEYQEQEDKYIFKLVHVTENLRRDGEVVKYLQQRILTSYRNIEFYDFHLKGASEQEISEYVHKYVIPGADYQIDRNVRQGDWGEIVTAAIVSYFRNLEVPINKLQWKINKNKAVFGTDLIAYNKGKSVEFIYYFEIKSRQKPNVKEGTNPYTYITIRAYNTLLKDEKSSTETIADFLERLFFERGEYDEAMKFKNIVKNPQDYNRVFELFFIIEKSNFIEDILKELNNRPPELKPLNVTIVFIDKLKQLVENTWQDIENSLVKILSEN